MNLDFLIERNGCTGSRKDCHRRQYSPLCKLWKKFGTSCYKFIVFKGTVALRGRFHFDYAREMDLLGERLNETGDVNQRDERSATDGSFQPDHFEALISHKPETPPIEKLLSFLNERVAFKIPSDLKHLDGVLEYLAERMVRLGITDAQDSEVIIALDEAIVNAIKHGNKCDTRKAVHIVAEFSSEGARFVISDEGPGFERDKVPDPTEPSRLLETSGRGLLLIKHIMDEVRFNHCGNEVEMFKRSCRNSSDPSEY